VAKQKPKPVKAPAVDPEAARTRAVEAWVWMMAALEEVQRVALDIYHEAKREGSPLAGFFDPNEVYGVYAQVTDATNIYGSVPRVAKAPALLTDED
jgi:hypothetical protein